MIGALPLPAPAALADATPARRLDELRASPGCTRSRATAHAAWCGRRWLPSCSPASSKATPRRSNATCSRRSIRRASCCARRAPGRRCANEVAARLEALRAALEKAEFRLAATQDLARVGDWELDRHTGRMHWSRELFRLFERPEALGVPDLNEALGYFSLDFDESHPRPVLGGDRHRPALRARAGGPAALGRGAPPLHRDRAGRRRDRARVPPLRHGAGHHRAPAPGVRAPGASGTPGGALPPPGRDRGARAPRARQRTARPRQPQPRRAADPVLQPRRRPARTRPAAKLAAAAGGRLGPARRHHRRHPRDLHEPAPGHARLLRPGARRCASTSPSSAPAPGWTSASTPSPGNAPPALSRATQTAVLPPGAGGADQLRQARPGRQRAHRARARAPTASCCRSATTASASTSPASARPAARRAWA